MLLLSSWLLSNVSVISSAKLTFIAGVFGRAQLMARCNDALLPSTSTKAHGALGNIIIPYGHVVIGEEE